MTNYEWLLQMGGEERQAWFDAEHVDANDDFKRENDVGADAVDDSDANDALDSREKLEADASELTADYAASGDVCDALCGGIVGLLDRQAAITRREVLTHPDERDEQIAELTAERDEWKARAESAELAMNSAEAMWTNADTEREQYRELLSEAIRYAHEIVNLQP